MNVFFVFQNKSFDLQQAGQYLWSPQTSRTGAARSDYANMTKVKKGDLIFHGKKSCIKAISLASEDFFEAPIPPELESEEWKKEGYRVNTTPYLLLTTPFSLKPYRDLLGARTKKESPFNVNGDGKEGYLYPLDKDLARLFLDRIIDAESDKAPYAELSSLSFTNDDDLDYGTDEISIINVLLEEEPQKPFAEWSKEPKMPEYTNGGAEKPKTPKRSSSVAARAIQKADYLCECDNTHESFLRKDSKHLYTEPHHLVPLSKQNEFENASLDREQNIVSLCSNCHNLLHYGRFEDKEELLTKIYKERQSALSDVGIDIDLDTLLSYYR